MFGDYVLQATSAIHDERILLIDEDRLDEATHYSEEFPEYGYEVVRYQDDLNFRLAYGEKLTTGKRIVIAHAEDYVPYDLLNKLRSYPISLAGLFPKLNAEALKKESRLTLDLLCLVYSHHLKSLRQRKQTEDFLRDTVYGKDNVTKYLEIHLSKLKAKAQRARKYSDWFDVAAMKAPMDVLAAQYGANVDTSDINLLFKDFILAEFGKLSQENSRESPVLVSHTMEYMHNNSSKFIMIVMDGMSEFDWEILSASFEGIDYRRTAAFAMIPTTTSLSRQCLLSNKYPVQLREPWKQSKEKAEFKACAQTLGYSNAQIGYARGYDAEFGPSVRCGVVIINDIDDIVHGQKQGRAGMYHAIRQLSEQEKLATAVKRFRENGFDVYISSDHGNTECIGIGKLTGTGLEAETKSHRMVVLQTFADKNKLMERQELIEYPKYYLDKKYDYLVCRHGHSLDAEGESVMTHGGISIDEVVVPFIEIKAL